MAIDRRTFLASGCAAAAGGALVPLTAIAAVGPATGAEQAAAAAPMAAVAVGPADLELRIFGWDQDDPRASSSQDGPSWIAIDQHWRTNWH
jgi:hypothetical protein